MPDMQGEGEENHTEAGAEKVPRRYLPLLHTHIHTHTPTYLNSTDDQGIEVSASKLTPGISDLQGSVLVTWPVQDRIFAVPCSYLWLA